MMRRLVAVAAAVATGGIAFAGSARADTAPELPCGTTVFTSCSDTAHFSDLDAWETPLGGTGTGCPDFLVSDYAHMVATGNGIEHNVINSGGVFWSNNTYTGDGTITFYDPANVDVTVIDDNGDIIATPTGPADGVLTGHLTQQFGVEQTRQGMVFGVTFSFVGTDGTGTPVSLHVTQRQVWNPTHPPFVGPPQHSDSSVRC